MPNVDFFNFFQRLLAIIATVYACVITLQSLRGWAQVLGGRDRYVAILRRYLVVHGLRLRFSAFWGDVIVCLLLCVAFLFLWHGHQVLYDIEQTLANVTHAARHA